MASIKLLKDNGPILIAALILAVPIITVGLSLLTPDLGLWQRLWKTTLPAYILNTVGLMVMVGVLSTLIGVLCAWFVTAYDFPGRKWLSWALVLPIVSPPYIIAYVYADLLEFYGPVQSSLRAIFSWGHGDYVFPSIRNLPGAAITLSLVLYPYIYLLVRSSFLNQSQSQLWAARNLGLPPRTAFTRVVLPCARPAIAGGLALVLMETLADFGVADFFAIPTFSVGIFKNWLIIGDKPAAMNLAGLMLLAVILLVFFEAGNRKGAVTSSGRTTAQAKPTKLRGPKALAMMFFCITPVALGLIIPVLRLIYHSLFTGNSVTGENLLTYVKNSVLIALIVAAIVVSLAVLLAYAQRGRANPVKRISIRLATLGYALPGALLAVGLLAPLSQLDQGLTKTLSSMGVWSGGLILTGTLIALIYALCVRFLTVAFNSVDAVILRPFNFDTLATRVYWLASDERLAEAAAPALIIMLIGLIPTLYLNAFLVKKDN